MSDMRETGFARLASEALKQELFTLIDVGCSSGIDDVWRTFGSNLRAYAIDPNLEEIQRLVAAETLPGIKYVPAFVGISPNDPGFARVRRRQFVDRSAFRRFTAYHTKKKISEGSPGLSVAEKTVLNTWHEVPLASRDAPIELQQYLPSENVHDIDFLKLDVDGGDFLILRSTLPYLTEAGLLGLKVEVNFFGSDHPDVHTFHNVDRLMKRYGFELFKLSTRPYSVVALPAPFQLTIPAQTEWGRLFQGDAIYFRDAIGALQSEWAKNAEPGKLLKLATLYSVFGLHDCAAEVLLEFRQKLSLLIEVDKALDVLVQDAVDKNDIAPSYPQYMRDYQNDAPRFWPARDRQDENGEARHLELQCEVDSLRAELAAANSALHGVMTSKTWRLTEPFRRLGIATRRLLRRQRSSKSEE